MRFCCRPGRVNESYACVGIPKAVIDDPDPKYAAQDVNVYFEGENSYDTDPPPEGGDSIVDYYWVWPSGSYEQDKSPDNGHLGWAKFSSTGERKVGLFVQDDEENWSTKEECTVRIVEVGLSAERGYVAVNNDDDNANEKPDYHSSEQTVTGENDLVEIQLSVNPDNNWTGCKVRLSVFGDNLDSIKIWKYSSKQVLVIPDGANYHKDYDPGDLPDKLYVEGISTTPAGQDVDIALLYRVDSLDTDQDQVEFIVLEVDQDMDGVDDTSEKTEEITPGGFIALNEDDDNDNGTPDKDESGSVTNEDDLVKLTLKEVSPTDLTGNVTLKAIAGGAKIKIWESQTKGGTPITLPETYATPSDLPEELWIEGYDTSSSLRDITLALDYTVGGTTFDDRIKVTVLEIDLDIDGISDADEKKVGGIVVRKYDNNNAPRKKIIVQKVKPNEWSGNVILSRNNTKVKVFDASSGGTEITFNGTNNKYANSTLPKNLWVEGYSASGSMRDVLLDLGLETPPPGYKDKVTFTVLWVDEPTMKLSSTDECSTDNDKRDNYKGWTVANHYYFGVQQYDADHGERMGWGTEAKGKVYPSSFNYPGNDLKLERDIEFKDWIGNGTTLLASRSFSASIPPGNDSGPTDARDDNPAPNGNIYDWDAPGLGIPTAPQNQVRRTRNNFKAFSSITVDGTKVRCSPVTEYFIRFSMKQLDAPSGSNWQVISPPDVTNDKQAGSGSTNLTWDLN